MVKILYCEITIKYRRFYRRIYKEEEGKEGEKGNSKEDKIWMKKMLHA